MSYSYKDGFREGVVFAFYSEGNILIEHRPTEEGGTDTFFTNGSIEDKDHQVNNDYREVALLREVNEEFDQIIKVNKFEYLGELKVEAINVLFYLYLITEWEGKMPSYTVEEGKKYAKLEWIKMEETSKHLKYDSAIEICDRISNSKKVK